MIFKKKLLSLLLISVFCLFFSNNVAIAEEDFQIPVFFNEGSEQNFLGQAIVKGEEIWVSESAMKSMGVNLIRGENNKGFYLRVEKPAEVFGIAKLSSLVGESLSLYFASLKNEETFYFNIVGMEALTGLTHIKSEFEVVFTKEQIPHSQLLKQRAAKPFINKEKIALVWDHVTAHNSNLAEDVILPGLNIISPTWFNLIDGSGLMANRASVSYVEEAHNKNYQVWALVSNGFNKANTTQFFKNESAKKYFVARLLAYSKLYNLDGINFDFENVDVNDRNDYVGFISMAASILKAEGLMVSVDVHIPSPNSNLSKSHDRGSLSKYVDYVMLMAYDEHWRTCPRAGSVASMPWVERAVQNSLAEGVPSNKLVLGVPFYMRKWEETVVKGKTNVRSATLTMDESNYIIASKSIAPTWNDELGQFYYSYKENGKTYKVWVESKESIKRKLSLIKKYNLAGAAAWRKGHESSDIWDVFKTELEN